MNKEIQAMPLTRGDATSPYTVLREDEVIEFTASGVVTCSFATGATTDTTVLAGSRYALVRGIVTITFDGTFNVG